MFRADTRNVDYESLSVWLLSRALVWAVVAAVSWLFVLDTSILGVWEHWDFFHYRGIAEHGYGGEPTGVPNEAFFPGFPATLWLGGLVGINATLSGLLVSFCAGGVAAIALGRLGALEKDEWTGRVAVIAWVASPAAVFLAAGYTEALFVAFAFTSWLSARRGNWCAAGVLAALSCTVRVNGLFLAVALGVLWLTTRRSVDASQKWSGFGWLFLPAVPLIAWEFYLYRLTGDWLAWSHAQSEGWGRSFTLPHTALINTWNAAFGSVGPEFEWMFRAEIVAMAVGVVLTLALLWWRRWGEATWLGLHVVTLSTSTWFFSVPRSTLLWWPLWITIAVLAAKRRWILWAYLLVSVPIMVLWTATFLRGQWAG